MLSIIKAVVIITEKSFVAYSDALLPMNFNLKIQPDI